MKSIIKNTFQWLVKKHENSQNFNVLKTVTRLMGLLVCGIITIIPEVSELNLLSFIATILLMDVILICFGLKESYFKTPKFFRVNNTSVQSLDRYVMTISLLKLVLFVVFSLIFIKFIVPSDLARTIIGGLLMGSYFPGPWIVAYFTKYKPFISQASTSTDKPWYYGKGGFGMAGNYTGKLGSVGGQSG
ncbi:MAG: hypothetical protein HRU43_00570 [Simkaniaceae bacterium]|nr:hypothetical protein [Simkaniaceae bacterium]